MNFALWRGGDNIPLQLIRLAVPQTIIIVKHGRVGSALLPLSFCRYASQSFSFTHGTYAVKNDSFEDSTLEILN